MLLLTKAQRQQLLTNGATRGDHIPVVKLFTPDGQATWLLSEIDPEDGDTAFGLCDLGMGFPEMGYVSLSELASVRGPWGLPIERDRHFTGRYPLSVYADAASSARCITTDPTLLEHLAQAA